MADSTPDAPPVTEGAESTPDNANNDNDTAAMVEALRKANAEAKKYRLEAKAHADQLAALAQQNMTETEKAIASARAEARTEALRESGSRLVDAEIRLAANGRNIDVSALLESLDRSAFVDEHGDPLTDKINKWVERLAPAPDNTNPLLPKVPQGVRSTSTTNGDPATAFANFISKQLSG